MQKLVQQGYRFNTRRTYSSAQKSFIDFCSKFGLSPLPASEQLILLYIAHLHSCKLVASSICVYLSGIRSLHVLQGFPPPPTSSPRIKLVLKAISEMNPPPAQRYPITYQMLCVLCNLLSSDYSGLLYKAVFCVAFFGALRSDEYVVGDTLVDQQQSPPLSLAQIEFGIEPCGLKFVCLNLARTKTTPHGIMVPIGCSSTQVCAVCLLKQYLRARYSMMCTQLSHPLFALEDGSPLTKSRLNKVLKSLVGQMGLDPSLFSSHSFRAGATSTAASVQSRPFQAWELKALGNWRSDTYVRYIRNVKAHKLQFAQRLTET